MSEELQIGRFAELVGLSVPQLRRYDRLQLLAPVGRSPESGYRYYSRQQTGAARVIALLRSMDMPLADIRRVLSGPEQPELERLFRDHRVRLEARLTEVHRLLEAVDDVLLEGSVVTTQPEVKLSGLAAIMPYLPVSDVQRSATYYQEALGFRLAWRTSDWQLAAIGSGEVEIFLVPWSGESSPPVQTCYVYADDPDALCSEYATAGADIEDPTASREWGMREFVVRDPDGHRLRIGRGEKRLLEMTDRYVVEPPGKLSINDREK